VVSRSGHSVVEILRRVSGLDDRIKEIPEEPSLPVDIIQMKLQEPTVFFIQTATPNISSSSLRRQLEIGESVDGLVPPEVLNYIRQNNLYVSSSGKRQF
jgi:nicotinic acid mononucleotide adenylyltransferase